MKPFLVSYRTQAAVIVAEDKLAARDCYLEKFLKGAIGVDKRKIKQVALNDLAYGGPELSKPKVLKTVVLVDGGEG